MCVYVCVCVRTDTLNGIEEAQAAKEAKSKEAMEKQMVILKKQAEEQDKLAAIQAAQVRGLCVCVSVCLCVAACPVSLRAPYAPCIGFLARSIGAPLITRCVCVCARAGGGGCSDPRSQCEGSGRKTEGRRRRCRAWRRKPNRCRGWCRVTDSGRSREWCGCGCGWWCDGKWKATCWVCADRCWAIRTATCTAPHTQTHTGSVLGLC